ncbi:cbb3-type cytochrome c oxidase subunit I [Wenxinia marina]|uniref:Heme/copper-type cytochrome/quinol oxidase, subunit 1 n=1 Tax=Wenxinia marina DSM 24838 TaxID=1123501 RepID=A0A0D0NQ46_9RHOB|nr:cbb3-type cytochrome c oxidase subunit I [Wenxinia marina]KIQ70405.1 Heme/copper-type cytochrome/quinol oxidase, subunit 1 [Wenxinia marina DSM 24838]GGL53440.1 cytochrome bo(3) ubiquinol oxidase subunit 1 [Wenxinia marina]
MIGLFLGTLRWDDVTFVEFWRTPDLNNAIAAAAAGLLVLGVVATLILLTVRGWWRPLWRDWLTSLDHKKIGIMYVALALVMFARAVAEANVMRAHQATAALDAGLVAPDHFAELFSTHGTIMIFLVAMPLLTGIMNFVMPLQIGARDVSFPLLNAISLMLTAAAAGLVMVSLVLGHFSTGGWSGYPPYTGADISPGEGPDYWIWALTLSSIGSTLTGMNFAVTLYKRRVQGMHLFRMPLFCWTVLCTSILMIFAMAPLTLATLMLWLDRHAGFHFFTVGSGGDMMNFANLFWLFGHPEVYILILPAFGVWSEVFSTFSGKRLFGYLSLVYATMAIAVLSFTVWLHHFFTMGQSANVNAAFGIATMLIGVPTGVKVYDWLLTMMFGRVRLRVPMLFANYFLVTFLLGGVTGVLLANPTVDYGVHNSLFLVAHFHNMLIPGTLFAMLAAIHLWFPKAFGFRLHEGWGRAVFWLMAPGFLLAFMPLYAMGMMGGMRRTAYFSDPLFRPWLWAAEAGAVLILAGFAALVVQIVVSVRRRDALAVPAGDPWDGRSLEWLGPAPAFEFNFAGEPKVEDVDAFTALKAQGEAYRRQETYEDIEMPRNSAVPVVIGALAGLAAFAMVWQAWATAALAFAGVWAVVIGRSFVRDTERTIPAAEVEAAHRAWLADVAAATPVHRRDELTPENRGLAEEPL